MGIKQKSIKALWANAAGRCSFTDCSEKLVYVKLDGSKPQVLGEMAHICSKKPGGNRYDFSQTDSERDDYKNLILLCPNHHSIIDKKENESVYTMCKLHKMKKEHEKKISASLFDESTDKNKILFEIFRLLEVNRQAWQEYGPKSKRAKTEPHNESLYNYWLHERLTTIVPNNRKIRSVLDKNKKIFSPDEISIVEKFISHVDSYEKWVSDEIPYKAVIRFPVRFYNLIKEKVNEKV